MSATPITISDDLWDGDDEGVVTTWLYADGATVKEGDIVAEIMVEKVEMEILAPVAGKLKIEAKAEAVIAKGSVIGEIA